MTPACSEHSPGKDVYDDELPELVEDEEVDAASKRKYSIEDRLSIMESSPRLVQVLNDSSDMPNLSISESDTTGTDDVSAPAKTWTDESKVNQALDVKSNTAEELQLGHYQQGRRVSQNSFLPTIGKTGRKEAEMELGRFRFRIRVSGAAKSTGHHGRRRNNGRR